MGLFDVLKKAKDIAEKVNDIVESQQKENTTSKPVQTSAPVYQTPKQNVTADMKSHFDGILSRNFADCEYRADVPASELLSEAHPACTPIQYMFYNDGKPCLAVVLVKRNTYNGMNVKGTKNICEILSIPYIRFFAEYPNEEAYVVERIKKYL